MQNLLNKYREDALLRGLQEFFGRLEFVRLAEWAHALLSIYRPNDTTAFL